jgi:hypothetical protein
MVSTDNLIIYKIIKSILDIGIIAINTILQYHLDENLLSLGFPPFNGFLKITTCQMMQSKDWSKHCITISLVTKQGYIQGYSREG